uniref:Aminotransferase class V domain-containing protein n=1 Tax=Kalanchoe fedtschenkoi TaxID=63787 RepID=A0A7N0TNS8_KALFE
MRIAKAEKRIAWLRSQIIGGDAEFESPFGRRRITYADHTASGRALKYTEAFIVNNVLPFYGNTHTSDSYVGHHTTTMVHEASHFIKTTLGGGPNDALLFCGSGSTAAIKRLQEVMGIAITPTMRGRVLETLDDQERWVVFVGPYEHHSNLLSWRHSLAEVVEIGLDENGKLDVEELRAQLDRYQLACRPLLGSFSACSNATGLLTDTRGIARLMHRYGAFVCVDYAASGPYEEIDMRSGEMDGYDAVFISPHKFLGGPGTPGILLMNKALYQLTSLPPSTCGGGTVNYVNGFSSEDTLYIEDIEEREDAGTPQIIQKIRAALTFWVKEYVGYEVIRLKEHEFLQRAYARLLPNRNIEILGSKSQDQLPIMSFLVFTTSCESNRRGKALHGPFVAKLLNDLFGIQARGGCACAGPYGHTLLGVDEKLSLDVRSALQKGYMGVKPGWTRVSFPYYMSNEEFEFVLDALEFISFYGQRFLPLYDFKWEQGEWSLNKKVAKSLLHPNPNTTSTSGQVVTQKPNAQNNENTINMYESYLERAKQVASLLPRSPPERPVLEGVDDELVMFKF